MKEKGLIFTSESVNAIRDGRQRQTRRVMKVQPERICGYWYWRGGAALKKAGYGAEYVYSHWDLVERAMLKIAPYQVGDRLFVKYRADGKSVTVTDYQLEVAAICVERLQDISEEDAKAEGVIAEDWERFEHPDNPWLSASAYRAEFARCWDEINGKRSPWASNPWVWVIEFKVTDEQS